MTWYMRPRDVPRWRWALGNLWRKLLYACGLHWKQQKVELTWYRLSRLIRARMIEDRRRWDTILRCEPCVYCGRTLPYERMTVEHVIPKSRGGRDGTLNKVGCCATCNQKRGSMPLLHYLLLRQGQDIKRIRKQFHLSQQRAQESLAKHKANRDKLNLTRYLPEQKYFRPPLATLGELATWKATQIAGYDQRNRKPTDVDLRQILRDRNAAG